MQTLKKAPPPKVTSFKTTQMQLDWLHALQSTLNLRFRSEVVKKLLKMFVEQIHYPFLNEDTLEEVIVTELFKDSNATLHDLEHELAHLQQKSSTTSSHTVFTTIKFTVDQKAFLSNLHQTGLTMSLSEAIRFIIGFYISILSRLLNNGGEEYD